MKKTSQEKAPKELIKVLREAEDYLYSLAGKVGELRDTYELPMMVKEIGKLKNTGKVKNITVAWMQRRYKIGYARASRLIDELIKKILVTQDSYRYCAMIKVFRISSNICVSAT